MMKIKISFIYLYIILLSKFYCQEPLINYFNGEEITENSPNDNDNEPNDCSCDIHKNSCDYLCCCDEDCPDDAINDWKNRLECIDQQDTVGIFADRCIDEHLVFISNKRRGLRMDKQTEDTKVGSIINNYCYSMDNSKKMTNEIKSLNDLENEGYKKITEEKLRKIIDKLGSTEGNSDDENTFSTTSPANLKSTDVNTYNVGDVWTVDGQWAMVVTSVKETDYRESGSNPAAVYEVEYTYTNIGYVIGPAGSTVGILGIVAEALFVLYAVAAVAVVNIPIGAAGLLLVQGVDGNPIGVDDIDTVIKAPRIGRTVGSRLIVFRISALNVGVDGLSRLIVDGLGSIGTAVNAVVENRNGYGSGGVIGIVRNIGIVDALLIVLDLHAIADPLAVYLGGSAPPVYAGIVLAVENIVLVIP